MLNSSRCLLYHKHDHRNILKRGYATERNVEPEKYSG